MKEKIHPKYNETVVKCGCGNSFTTRSTRKEIVVDVCNVCHPFYSGKERFIDSGGRIEKFKSKFAGNYASLSKKKKK
ncbi:50S ribosomal protein L31 [Bremerella sp.]|uniref:50S ribosomal protein L31 n=1 Tax=Bremerella sp. TaxID=2795602 RepID=UPI0039199B53